METTFVPEHLDMGTLLDMLYQRVVLLEQEIELLKVIILKVNQSAGPSRTFASLRGVWSGVEISEDDFKNAQISLPDDL